MARFCVAVLILTVVALSMQSCDTSDQECQDTVSALSIVRIDAGFDSFAEDIQVTEDRGFIICGRSAGVELDNNDTDYSRSFDAYLVKTDGSGAVQWAKTFGTDDADEGRSVRAAGDGGYILVGNAGDIIFSQRQVYDPVNILIVKVDATGSEVWSRVWDGGGNIYNAAYSVCVNLDGSFVVAGSTSEVDIGPDFALLVKFDRDGNEVWHRRFKSGREASARDVIATRDGGYAFAGYFAENNSEGHSLYVVKTDEEGIVQWEYTGSDAFNYGNYQYGNGIVQTLDGGFAIVGETFSDLIVAKLDHNGEPQWLRSAPEVSNALGFDLIELGDGSLVAAGESYSENYFGFFLCRHMYAVRFSADGDVLQTARFGTGSGRFDFATSLVEDDNGNVVLAGSGFDSDFSEYREIYLVTTDLLKE